MSPDGNFLASGSENGKIYVWNAPTGEQFSQDYNCDFVNPTSDIDWNPKFNMIATSGFGESYPVLLYIYEKTQKEVDFSLGRNLIEDEAATSDRDTQISTPKNKKNIGFSGDDKSDRRSFLDKESDLDDEEEIDFEDKGYKTPIRSDHDRRFDE